MSGAGIEPTLIAYETTLDANLLPDFPFKMLREWDSNPQLELMRLPSCQLLYPASYILKSNKRTFYQG
jgi:hypothetical protein